MKDPDHGSITVAEFLAWESRQSSDHELINGLVVAMTTPTRIHAALVRRLRAKIEAALGETCDIYAGDMTVTIENTLRHNAPRPDIMVTCDERDRRAEDLRTNSIRFPKIIIEVLSPSTAEADTGSKIFSYFAIPTMVEYLIVDSRERYVVLHQRLATTVTETWPTSEIDLMSVGVRIAIDELYDGLV